MGGGGSGDGGGGGDGGGVCVHSNDKHRVQLFKFTTYLTLTNLPCCMSTRFDGISSYLYSQLFTHINGVLGYI